MMNRRHSPPLRPFPALLALAALLLSPAAALPSPPPVLLSLAPDSAVTEKARKTWDFWTAAQSDPALAAEFAKPSDDSDSPHPSHFVSPSPYLALRIDPRTAIDPRFVHPILCRFDFYYVPTNALPGLDPDAPVFRKRRPFYTEVVDVSDGFHATVPLPSCISGGNFLLPASGRGYDRIDYRDRLVIRVTLQVYDGPDACNFTNIHTVLPPFGTLNETPVLASTNLPPDIWQSAGEGWRTWTPASYSATVPDDLPARFPHVAVLSAEDFAALADRPVLARRLALSATPVVAHGVKAPLLPASPAIPSNSVLFRHPSTDAKHTPSLHNWFLDHDNLTSVFSPPASVPGAYPVYALWISAAFLLAALLSALLLVRVFRRPPARRTSLWIAFPAAALSLALLTLLAGLFLLPRTPRSDAVLFRVGYAGSPEEFCRASVRCFSFRNVDWAFDFPSAQAGLDAIRNLPDHPPCSLRRSPEEDLSTLYFDRGVRATAITVQGTWFGPSTTPLTVEDVPYFDTIAAPEGTHRTITPTRDLDDLWVVIGTNRYHLGPVAAGTPVHPLPSQLLTTNDVLPSLPDPFDRLPPIAGCGCPDHSSESAADPLAGITINTVYGDDGPGSTSITFPDGTSVSLPPDEAAEYLKNYAESHPAPANPAPAPKPAPPWITIARVDSIDPWPAGPRLSPATQSTEQTLWITEWP